MRQVVAAEAHEIPDRPPLQVTVGQQVHVSDRDPGEWPEFVFVNADANGGSGWVPARHLSVNAGRAVVLVAYDTTELPTREGEVLDVVEEDLQSGWLWCRSASSREGWVPMSTVQDGQSLGRPI